KLVPDQDHAIVTAGYGIRSSTNVPVNDNYVTTAAAPDGSFAVSYVPAGQTITVNLSFFSGTVNARWFDPTNNTFTPVTGSPFANAGSVPVTPRGKNSEGTHDWVLVLRSK